MTNDKLKPILETFDSLNHDEQVDLFVALKEELLKMRKARAEHHAKNIEFDQLNLDALKSGDEIIYGLPPIKN